MICSTYQEEHSLYRTLYGLRQHGTHRSNIDRLVGFARPGETNQPINKNR